MRSTTSRARLGALSLASLTAAALALPLTAGGAQAADPLAPLRQVSGTAVPGQYIVVLKTGAVARSTPKVLDKLHGEDRVKSEFFRAVRGFTAKLDGAALADVRRDPQVAYVEPDQVVRTQATQTNAPWGLDRIDQRNRPVNGSYTYTRTGAGVTAYIIDTGIRASHQQFGGRVAAGFNATGDTGGTNDCQGHGTHVAGTVGGSTYGVAKAVRLVPVRVLKCDGTGTSSSVVAGIDWVARNRTGPSVANMSLGGVGSAAIDDAVKRAIAAGVTFAVAAGNSSSSACWTSPARVPAAITVGATQSNDRTAGFSNWGSCIDLFAPGVDIESAWNTSDTATYKASGTSMASPHVAGAAALYLQGNPSATPAQVSSALVGASTPNVLSWAIFGSPNKLLHVAP